MLRLRMLAVKNSMKRRAADCTGSGHLQRDEIVGFRDEQLIVHKISVAFSSPKSNPIKDVMGWECATAGPLLTTASELYPFCVKALEIDANWSTHRMHK